MDAINVLPGIALPTPFGPPAQALQPGQVIQALVLELLDSGAFRLQLPQSVVDVRSDVPLTPGSTIALAVKTGASTRLVIYADGAAAQGGDPLNLAGRRPIGEAVIIARAPLGAQPKIPGEPVMARDAPSIAPARLLARQPDARAAHVSPERALGEAVRVAAIRQGGLAPLFADVEVIQAAPGALPAPVRAAAQQLLNLRIPLDEKLTVADVKQAFARSGVLLEPRLAAARQGQAANSNEAAPMPAGDLKAALLVFRQVLKVWAASEPLARAAAPPAAPDETVRPAPLPAAGAASITHLASARVGMPDGMLPNGAPLSAEQATTLAKSVATALHTRDAPPAPPAATVNGGPPPPYRGAALAGQPPVPATLVPDATPREAAERLIAQTDGALARQTLLQVASLPDRPESMPRTEASQRWTFEVPFSTPQGTGIAQFEISRDGRNAKPDAQSPVWRARFALDVEPMGPVHALIALAGERASVTLWAERLSTATRLNEQAPLLSEALRAAELEPAEFQLRVGAPPAARQAAPGRFMDRAT